MSRNNYIDNKRFYKEIKEYYTVYNKWKNGEIENKPPIPEYIGECIYKIANNLANHKKFIGYTFKDEMVGDAIENCIKAINNFNPEKSQNPFAYFTQIAYNAFIRRIKTEKKHSFIKVKSLENFRIECLLEGEKIQDNSGYLDVEQYKKLTELFEK